MMKKIQIQPQMKKKNKKVYKLKMKEIKKK